MVLAQLVTWVCLEAGGLLSKGRATLQWLLSCVAVPHSLWYPLPEAFSHSIICLFPVSVLFSFSLIHTWVPFSTLDICLHCWVLINYSVYPLVDRGKTEGYVQANEHCFTGGLRRVCAEYHKIPRHWGPVPMVYGQPKRPSFLKRWNREPGWSCFNTNLV